MDCSKTIIPEFNYQKRSYIMKKIAVVLLALGALSSTAFASSRDAAGPLGTVDTPSELTASNNTASQMTMGGEMRHPLTRYERDSKAPS